MSLERLRVVQLPHLLPYFPSIKALSALTAPCVQWELVGASGHRVLAAPALLQHSAGGGCHLCAEAQRESCRFKRALPILCTSRG